MAMPEFHFPEPVTFTKKEVFNGTEMETVYREANVRSTRIPMLVQKAPA